MLMTTELYERMNKLCDARVMFDDEQYELEQAVFAAITAVGKAEQLLLMYEEKHRNHYDNAKRERSKRLKEYREKELTDVA